MNTKVQKLYDHLTNSKDWENEAKGTIAKTFRFVNTKLSSTGYNISVFFTNLDGGRVNFQINVNGWYLYLNSEMTIKDFKVIVDNVR